MAPADPNARYEEIVRLIAHDLRNPLTAVQLNGQLLEQAAAQTGHEKQQRWARLVVEAARRMDEMVGKLVEAERLRSGKIALARSTVVLGGLLPDVLAGLGPDIGTIRLVLPREPVAFRGDRERMGQVFAVLLRMTRQEADPGREIAVEAWARDGRVVCSLHAQRGPRPPNGDGAGAGTLAGRSILDHFARTVVECHDGTLAARDGDASAFGYEVALPARSEP